jgi:hypothetical protein
VRSIRTLIIPGVAGGFLNFTEYPAPWGYSPAEGDFCGAAVLHTPETSLGTGLCLTRADQLDLLYFLEDPTHVTGGYPVHLRYASPCNQLRLTLTVVAHPPRPHSVLMHVDVTNVSRRGVKELSADLVVPKSMLLGERIAEFFPGTSPDDDLDLEAPDGNHLTLLENALDRWPCRAHVERAGPGGERLFGGLIQPVARRLYRDVTEDELAAFLEARVVEAGGAPDHARERAIARELIAVHTDWRREREARILAWRRDHARRRDD